MMEKALAMTAVDAVMPDIEDGVPLQEKPAARQVIAACLATADANRPACFVRINSVGTELMRADLEQVVQPGTDGLVLPKVETAEQIKLVDGLLAEREKKAKQSTGCVQLLVALESPLGLLNAYAIATASPRVTGLMLGGEDLGKELGLPLKREGEAREMLYPRSMLVMAAAAAHVQSIDGVWPDLQDSEGLKRYALQGRRLGFTGMAAIHPAQVEAINQAFSPSDEEVAYCRQIVQTFQDAEKQGQGAIAVAGQLIDPPIVERARRTVAFADRVAARAAR